METRETLGTYGISEIPKHVAKRVIMTNHYSRKWNTAFGVYNYGILDPAGACLGVAVYGYPMNPQSFRSVADVDNGQFVELNRLWADDVLGKNTETWMMAGAHKRLRDNGVTMVQSFADGRIGVGTIYQAAGFGYYGFDTTTFHRDPDTGETHHDTQFSNTANASGMVIRNAMHVAGNLETFEVNTYRYIKPLTKAAARRIKVPALPYPKERMGMRPVADYTVPPAQFVRATVMAHIMGDQHTSAMMAFMTRYAGLDGLIDAALANRWVADLLRAYHKDPVTVRADMLAGRCEEQLTIFG